VLFCVYFLCCWKQDFTSRFPARAAYAVKDLPKVGVTLAYAIIA